MNTKAFYIIKRIVKRVDFQFATIPGTGIDLAYRYATRKFFVYVFFDFNTKRCPV